MYRVKLLQNLGLPVQGSRFRVDPLPTLLPPSTGYNPLQYRMVLCWGFAVRWGGVVVWEVIPQTCGHLRLMGSTTTDMFRFQRTETRANEALIWWVVILAVPLF